MTITLADKKERLALYRKAERAILCGHQRYTIDGMTFDRGDLNAIQKTIKELESEVSALESGSTGFSCVGVIF